MPPEKAKMKVFQRHRWLKIGKILGVDG